MVVSKSKGRKSNSKHHGIEMSRYFDGDLSIVGERVFSNGYLIGRVTPKFCAVFPEFASDIEYRTHIDFIRDSLRKEIVITQ